MMNDSDEIKMLACSIKPANFKRLEKLLNENQIRFSLEQSTHMNLKYAVAAGKPDLIITDQLFWIHVQALPVIKELREVNNTPLVIWTNEATDKMMAAVFNMHHICFIKQSENEFLLIDAISKMLNPIV